MVMKRKNMMRKNLRQTIRKSMGRYLAIVSIIALGAGLFSGLRVTKVDMVQTAQSFTDNQNMFDVQALSSYGWSDSDVEAFAQAPGIAQAEGSISMDVLVHVGQKQDLVYRMLSIPQDINQVSLVAGRMPAAPNECLADNFFNTPDFIGTTVEISSSNEEQTRNGLSCDSYTVVGLAATPLYLNMERGSTSLGTGSIADYLYLPPEGFDLDFFTEINLTLPGSHQIYSDSYDRTMDDMAQQLEPLGNRLAQQRYDSLLADANAQYADGLREYEDGLRQYEDGKAEAEAQLDQAWQDILSGEAEIEENRHLISGGYTQLNQAQAEIDRNRAELAQGRKTLEEEKAKVYTQLDQAQTQLDTKKTQVEAAKTQVEAALQAIEAQLAPVEQDLQETDASLAKIEADLKLLADAEQELLRIDAELAVIATEIPRLEGELAQLEQNISQLDAAIAMLDAAVQAARDFLTLLESSPLVDSQQLQQAKDRLEELTAQRNEAVEKQQALMNQTRQELLDQLAGNRDRQQALTAQREELLQQQDQLAPQQDQLLAQREELKLHRQELAARKALLTAPQPQLLATQKALETAQSAIAAGQTQLSDGRAEADSKFHAAEQQLSNGEAQLHSAQYAVDSNRSQLDQNAVLLDDAALTLADGKLEYETQKTNVWEELNEAKAQLEQGEQELKDAKAQLDSMQPPAFYALTRNTNPGYVVLESDSDIIAGVAKIFPVFFLSVAALVCITTMTRMVDEERTQIGILKALGYSRGAIMGKYMTYSGSAALIGCAAGVTLGSVIFPKIIWHAYCLMYGFSPDVVLTFDWMTCLMIVASYTALTLLVTWYCCRRELQNVPAELMRPKAPADGKKLLLEKLPLWKKLSFLNKVALRNIFRYRQRLAMMLLGIGGCTALLVTGFGIKDSISNIVNYQFDSVTLYDLDVMFEEEQTPQMQQQFRQDFASVTDGILFCHKSTIDLDFDDRTKNLNLLVTDQPLDDFISLHTGETPLAMPGKDEVLVSIGTAKAMGIHEGDRITLRSSDQEQLSLTVSGIFDNHVFNYAIVSADTVEGQWGHVPPFKTGFVFAKPDADPHVAGAAISGSDGVLNVLVNQDTANQVNGMMDAMDSIVVTVVCCAGLLAVIVLYNLTNINIKERIREIATIKVLGFNARETGSYVFKENLVLTCMGMLLGLGCGKLLHAAVMSYVRIDMVWFDCLILPRSYLWAAVGTLLAALAVDFVMYFQLEKINMAEALKSVE